MEQVVWNIGLSSLREHGVQILYSQWNDFKHLNDNLLLIEEFKHFDLPFIFN